MYIINQDYIKAIEMAQKMAQSESLTSKMFAYSILLDYSKETNNLDSVYYYATEKEKCTVILNEQASANAVIHQNSFYNYTLRDRENLRLLGEQKYLQYMRNIFALISVLIFVLLLWLYERNKSLKRQLALQLSKMELIEVEKKESYHIGRQFDKDT